MVNPSICAPCRMRKVRCDSQQPECGQCLQARRMFQCTYDVPTSKPTRDNLRKGEACMPCRRKKKKCDAVQPICDRCSTAGIGHECFYKERLPQKSPVLTETTTISLDIPQDPSPNLSPTSNACSPSPSTRPPQYTFLGNTAGLQFPVSIGNSNDVALASPVGVDEENAQIPDTPLDDLNTSFRLLFLSHREQFGVYLPFGKNQAIILGDMSNACVHQFFVHFAHAIGCHFHQARHANFSMQGMEDAHLTLAYETLRQMKEADDPFIYGQAHHYLALSAMYSQPIPIVIAYHEEAVKIVERNGLHTIKDPGHLLSDPHLEASEVLERAVFLGSLLVVEIMLDIVGVKKRTLCYTIEDEYQYRFPKAFPTLFVVSPSILRVRSLLLFKEVSDMIMIDSAQPGVEVGALANNCVRLVHALTSHIDGLTKFLAELSNEDLANAVSLRSSQVQSLTALAEIFDIMSRISPQPLAFEYRGRCITALMRAIEAVHQLGHDNFLVIGLFLAVSLKRLSTLLDFTISRLCGTPTEGIDLDALNSGRAIVEKAKELLRAAFQLVSQTPNSLPSKLSELLT